MNNSISFIMAILIGLQPPALAGRAGTERAPDYYPDQNTFLNHQIPAGGENESQEYQTNIYVTIDDGPSAGSYYLSNTALADSIYLTMFVIGDSVFQNIHNTNAYTLYRSNKFITAGNHSYSHAGGHYRLYYQNPEQVIQDFRRNADTLQLSNKIARLPGRNTWRINGRKATDNIDTDSAANGLASMGYRVFGWDIEWKGAQPASRGAIHFVSEIDKMARRKTSFTPGNIIILCHESMFMDPGNKDQFHELIKEIRKKPWYHMKSLADYPATRKR